MLAWPEHPSLAHLCERANAIRRRAASSTKAIEANHRRMRTAVQNSVTVAAGQSRCGRRKSRPLWPFLWQQGGGEIHTVELYLKVRLALMRRGVLHAFSCDDGVGRGAFERTLPPLH